MHALLAGSLRLSRPLATVAAPMREGPGQVNEKAAVCCTHRCPQTRAQMARPSLVRLQPSSHLTAPRSISKHCRSTIRYDPHDRPPIGTGAGNVIDCVRTDYLLSNSAKVYVLAAALFFTSFGPGSNSRCCSRSRERRAGLLHACVRACAC
jgi:hypothetical protein